MLTGLKLGNFKAFGDTQNIPIKPLTLIYGANSAGKSSIIQGLLLACHANETGNVDAHQTRLGGDSVNLGGFRQYVHRRNALLSTKIGINFYFWMQYPCLDDSDKDFDYVKHPVEVNFVISKVASNNNIAQINSCELYLDNTQLLYLTRREDNSFKLEDLNLSHPLFNHVLRPYYPEIDNYDLQNKTIPEKYLTIERLYQCGEELKRRLEFTAATLIPDELTYGSRVMLDIQRTDDDLYSSDEKEDSSALGANSLLRHRFVDLLVSFSKGNPENLSVKKVWEELSMLFTKVQYLGPLRTYPPRYITFANDYDKDWYASGGYAWEVVRRDSKVRGLVNDWLGSKRLQTRYELSVRRYIAEDQTGDPLEELVLRDKRFDTIVSHRDVGFGISQVLPVLVSAYASENKIIAIEQPEIHLHPALQAELGDVFIQSALGENRNTFLLETHSEHLLLRIMRRMRETANGTLPEGIPPVRPEDVAVLFVQPKQDNSTSVVTELRLDEDGEFIDRWPGGFFEEGAKELFG